jgi:hypothetical protein
MEAMESFIDRDDRRRVQFPQKGQCFEQFLSGEAMRQDPTGAQLPRISFRKVSRGRNW